MAYATHIAAALSGATMRQLAYWRANNGSGPLLRPELTSDSRTLYSFRDVVALRTVTYLRDEVSLQRIRKAVVTLRHLGNREHLAKYTLVASDDSVVWVTPSQSIDLVKNPGQQAPSRPRTTQATSTRCGPPTRPDRVGLKVLLDEQVPAVLMNVLPVVARSHEFRHVHGLGWTAKKDVQLFRDAGKARFDVVVTADLRQLEDLDETSAIRRSKIHHVRFTQKEGLTGLALAVASVTAAMPGLLRVLEGLDSQDECPG